MNTDTDCMRLPRINPQRACCGNIQDGDGKLTVCCGKVLGTDDNMDRIGVKDVLCFFETLCSFRGLIHYSFTILQ